MRAAALALVFAFAASLLLAPAFAGTGPNGGGNHGKGSTHIFRTSPKGKR